MKWFVEERQFSGTWCVCIYHGPMPNRKRAGGPDKVFRADPVAVPPFLHDLPGEQIAQFLSPDGQFHALKLEGQIAVADMLRQPNSAEITIPVEWWAA